MAPIALSAPSSPPHSPTSTNTPGTQGSSSSPSSSSSTPLNQYRGYDHVQWYVGNAKQAASYYVTRFGFRALAYRGLETGCRVLASHVVGNGRVTFVLTSPLRSLDCVEGLGREERELLREVHAHLSRHGDGVKDVAFAVDDVGAVLRAAVRGGAEVVSQLRVLRDAEGEVKVAIIKTYGDTTHTLVERGRYRGVFLPGYRSEVGRVDALTRFLPEVRLQVVDHCVGNQDWGEMEEVCQ